MTRSYRPAACFLLIVIAFCFSSTSFFSGSAQIQDRPTYRVSVDRVYDYVSVLGPDDKFVKGLTAQDFIVEVNGELAQVESANEVHNVTRDSAEWTRFSSVEAAIKEIQTGETNIAPEHIVLLFDVFNSSPISIRGAKKTAFALLDKLLPIDRVSVYEFNGTLRLLTPPVSPGPEEARAVIKEISGLSRNPFLRPTQAEVEEVLGIRPTDFTYQQKLHLYRDFLGAIQQLAVGLAQQAVAKRVVLFSEGANLFSKAHVGSTLNDEIDEDTNDDYDFSQAFIQQGLDQLQAAASNLQNFMAGTDVTFHVVRRGVQQPDWVLALDLDLPSYSTDLGSNQTLLGILDDMFSERLDNARAIALATGGRFFDAGYSDERLVDELLEETGNYYHLFYRLPENFEQDDFNTVEIRTTNPEYRVRHKRGFFGPKTREYLNAHIKETQQTEAILQAEARIELKADCRAYAFPNGGSANVLLYMEIDPQEAGISEENVAAFELGVESEDCDGRVLFSGTRKVRGIALADGVALIRFFTSLPFPPSGGALTINMRDPVSGKQFWTRRSINIQPVGESDYTLSQPLLLRTDETLPATVTANEGAEEIAEELSSGLSGRPISGDRVRQGERLEVVLFIGKEQRTFDPEDDQFSFGFYLERPNVEDPEFELLAENENVYPLREVKVLRYHASVPLGYSPFEKGQLVIDVYNSKTFKSVIVRVPFTIENFDPDRANELGSDESAVVEL